jgi:uncharacterized repeat protein (TIGR03943 family)
VALRLGLADAALAYVKAGLQPLLVGAGIVLVVLGGSTVLRSFRGHDEEHEPDLHGHEHHVAHGPKVAWLLVLPLLALLLIAPPALGSFAAGRQSTRPPTTSQTGYPPLPDPIAGAVELGLTEYVFRALYDRDRSLEGERIRLVGFVTPDDEADGYLLTRFRLNCCAADAQAVHVDIVGDDLPRAGDTWLEVEGYWQLREGEEPGTPTARPPRMQAESIRVLEAPAQPYEY